ncbi:hypothetical protein ES708_27665 [subsurface metagenome]
MPIPKEVLERMKEGMDEAEVLLKDYKDIITDMRLAGMDTTEREKVSHDMTEKLRQQRVFYGRQKAKSK